MNMQTSKIKVYTPPEYPSLKGKTSIFLGGSIEMGKAIDWQKDFIFHADCKANASPVYSDWIILNPRRPDWNSDWEQDIRNPSFNQQVNWELDYLERATYRIFFFTNDTISPITLLELGRFWKKKNTFVIIQSGYKRKGNVDIFVHRYGIKTFPDIKTAVDILLPVMNRRIGGHRRPLGGGGEMPA